MASKSKYAPKVKPSRVFGFATDFPDMTPAKYAPGTQFSGQEFTEYNKDLPDHAKLWPGSYRVEVKSEGDPKKEETITTFFKHTSGPFEGQIVPRDITVKKAGEVVSFTDLHDPKHIKPTQLLSPGRTSSGYFGQSPTMPPDSIFQKSAPPVSLVGQANYASEVLSKFGEHLKSGEVICEAGGAPAGGRV